jgi:hypothetical protein
MKSEKILLLFLLFLGVTNANHTSQPCHFLDTINITAGVKDSSGKYYHDGVTYELGTFAEYNFILEEGVNRVTVDSHIRGCICKYKPCIRVCCRGNQSSFCVKTSILEVPTTFQGDLTINLDANEYGVLEGKPCVDAFRLEPLEEPNDVWNFVQVRYRHYLRL